MRKLKLFIIVSLDGKIARADGSVDWLPESGPNDYGFQDFYDSIDSILMGYKTYEISLDQEDWYYGDKKTYVFSKDPLKFYTPHVELVNTPPENHVKKIKKISGKDIWLLGGGKIIAMMHDHGLIDEYRMIFVPIVLGEGIDLFPNIRKPLDLKLMEHKIFSNGLCHSFWIPRPKANPVLF
jgi:dihydrofolate reductase